MESQPIPIAPPPPPYSSAVKELVTSSQQDTTKPKSKSNKDTMGVPRDHVVVWIPYDVSKPDNSLLERASSAMGVKKVNWLRDLLRSTIEAQRADLEELAKDYAGPTTRRGRKSSKPVNREEMLARQEKSRLVAAELLREAGVTV